MLVLVDVALRRGSELLFERVNLSVYRGQKFGLTGANGSGKSSLLALIRGELAVDQGDFNLAADIRLGVVEQETPMSHQPALEYVIDGDEELRDLQQRLQSAQTDQDGAVISACHERLQDIDGYQANSRAARLLDGLGFSADEMTRALCQFSGGWIMRLNLARALMCRSDLLLLDEPTNHLDLDAVIWLEQWLRRYQGTLLLISHDRDFLDAVVDHIAHVEGQGIQGYRGNYSAFEQQRAERLSQQQAAYDKQQQSIAHMQRYIDRFRAKATKARQAQSRIKALEKMTLMTPAHVDSPFHFEFRSPRKLPTSLLRLDGVAVGYADHTVLQSIDFSLIPGERIGLLGLNGAGKSTFIKLLSGELQPISGKQVQSSDLRVGYFAQHQLAQLDIDSNPLLSMQRLDPDLSERDTRHYLGGFNFRGDKVLQSISTLSGGEKARLVLAMIIWQRPNLLLLDEPTNHLDLEMRLALNQALQGFEGSVVLVSHDRHLLRSVCDDLWLVDAGQVNRFDSTLDDYPDWLSQRKARAGGVVGDRGNDRNKRQEIKGWQNRLRKVEREMGRLDERRRQLELRLSDDAIYRAESRNELEQALAQQHGTAARIEQLEEEWLQISEQLETCGN